MTDKQDMLFGFEDFDFHVKIDAPKDKSIFESSKGVFIYNEPFCKHCFFKKSR